MSEADVNMSMRKFLKQVGVTSQQEIEAAIRDRGGLDAPVRARMVLTIEALGLVHEIEGEIGPVEAS